MSRNNSLSLLHWLTVHCEDSLIHVLPVGDLKDHSTTADCWCSPDADEDICVHNSMDGREHHEQGRALQ